MKKTTLLVIGALAFVLQAKAANVIYYEDFEEQTLGATPQTWTAAGWQTGGAMWVWAGGAASTTWDIESILDPSGFSDTQAAVFGSTPDGSSGWFGFSSQAYGLSYIPGDNNQDLSDYNLTMEIESISGGVTPTLWFVQNNAAGNQVWAASYVVPMNADGKWTPVNITLDELTVQETGGGGNSEPFNAQASLSFAVDGGANNLLPGINNVFAVDDITLTAENPIPEPGTIALLTLGGLGALVAIRRRS
jgi:hypothetical protein